MPDTCYLRQDDQNYLFFADYQRFQQLNLDCYSMKHHHSQIDIDIDYSKRNEMIKKSGGRTSVPQIFFKDRHIGGCDDLYKLEEDNGLENFVK